MSASRLGILILCFGIIHTDTLMAANSCAAQFDNTLQAGRQNPDYQPDLSKGISVSSSRTLKRALKTANDGDKIIVEDGVYDIGWVEVSARITLVGRTRWGGVIKGRSVISLFGAGSEISGLRFEDGGRVSWRNSRDHSLYIQADGILIRDNYFWNVGVNSTVSDKTGITIEVISAKRVRIERNIFEKSHSIAIKTDDNTREIIILKNDFLRSPSFGGAGEIAHIGDALSLGQAISPTDDRVFARIEANYVCGWTLESELVSIKSDKNMLLNNFVEESGSSAFVIRMGNQNTVRGNIMLDNVGFPVRISGEGNVIDNNSFFGTGALVFLHDEIAYPKPTKNLARAYWAARRNLFRGNTYTGYDQFLGIRDQYWDSIGEPSDNIFQQNVIYTDDPQSFLLRVKKVSSGVAVFSETNVVRNIEYLPH